MWNPNLFGCNPRPNPSQLLRGEEAAEEGRNAAQQPSQQQPHFASVVEAFRLSPAVIWFGAMSLEQKSKQGGWLVLDIATCVCIWLELLYFVWSPPWHLSIWYWQIFWHSIWHIFWHSIWHSIWHIFWHSTWHIIWQICWHSIWQTFWHFIWHIFWHTFWHSIWHIF